MAAALLCCLVLWPEASSSKPSAADDLAWLSRLVDALASGSSREEMVELLGEDISERPDSRRRKIRPGSPMLASAEVYPLAHIGIDVAVNLDFHQESAPQLELLESLFGTFHRKPRPPDKFGGPERAHYHEVDGSSLRVRILAELASEEDSRVLHLRLDAEPRR